MRETTKIKLSYKIFISVFATLSALFILSSWIVYSLTDSIITSHLNQDFTKTVDGIRQVVEKSASLSRRSYLRAIAEQYKDIAGVFYRQALAGKITEAEAKHTMTDLMMSHKIGNSGYIYIIDSNAIVKVHPKNDVLGMDVREELFVKKQLNKKSGYLEYTLKNPDDLVERQKVLYMSYFKPWDWIISVSAYRDELGQLIQQNDFNEELRSVKVMENGYSFVIDLQGNIILHPHLEGNVFEHPAYAKFMQDLIKSKRGKFIYDWIDPADGLEKEKIIIFDTIDEHGWLVAATSYIKDFYAPLKILKNIFIGLLLTGLLLSVFISYFLSRSITSPLKNLIRDLSAHSDDNCLNQPSIDQLNEIESLSSYFAVYIDQIRANNRHLEKLNAEQRESALKLSIFKEVFDNIVEGISVTDKEGTIVLTNPAFTKITGYSASEAIGQNPRILKSDRHPSEFYENMWKQIREQGYWTGEIWNTRKSGEVYPEWLTISTVKNCDGEINHYAAVFDDITTLIEQKEKIHFLAYHDHLTNLPNRLTIQERLKELMSEQSRQGGNVVCIVIDLDNFKPFNDLMGQEYGDALLKEYAERTKAILRPEDVLGRIGGDDFVLLFTTPQKGNHHVLQIANRLFSSVNTPFDIAGHKTQITLNLGIAVFPDNARNPDELLKRANLALHKSQETKGNSISFFDSKFEDTIKKKLYFLNQIRLGVENDEFVPFFQPKVDLITGEIRGMEALARWTLDGKLVNSADFIPIAEESGLIISLSAQIYKKAFHETVKFHESGHFLHLSVNLSPAQFQDEYLIDRLLTIQKESGLDAKYIELEITESVLFNNTDHAKEILGTLAGHGFSISIDDFGTGYSSLQYLKQLPINTLKIDMTFISGIGNDKNDENLVQTIAILAKQFGLRVVAEGVERQDQIDFLIDQKCEDGQGYFYGKPMSSVDFTKWLSER